MGKMDDFEPLPVEDNPSGTPADKPPITDRPVRKPRTRLTKWLAKIAGVYDGEMTPKTETEYYLNEIAENGGGGGTVPSEDAAKLSDAIEEGGLGWIEPAQVLYETDAATQDIALTAPIIELTEGDSMTLSFTLGSAPAVEATALVKSLFGVLRADFELSPDQWVSILDEAIVFSADPDGAAFTITQPAVIHKIDSKFLAGGSGGGIGFAKKTFTFGAAQTIEAGQAATIVAYNGYTATPMVGYDTKLANWFSCDEKPGLIIISTSYILHSPRGGDMEGYDTTVFNASGQSISVKANTKIDYNLLYQTL